MGIKDLWSILTPFCERKPLFELQGKRVAVDLSCWICEAQNIAEYQVQPRMYLRNLYFRTCYLLLMEVEPVFVLEGKAPELKFDTIAARNAIQFKGAKPKKDGIKTGKDRTRFHFVLAQCQEMLNYMGLACIKGNGEAESLCAYLNEDGLVDGCISQDSDCFAYGAKTVYRNFSISTQGAHSASGGSVDVYDISKAYNSLKFGRNKIIALALLCGCDYSEGIFGVGKDSALKLFEMSSDEEILNRLRSWRENRSLYEEFEQKISDKNICTSCGHCGKLQSHTRIGCNQCKTTKGCDFTKFKNERLAIKNELNIRSKALEDPDFPSESLIKEFSIRKDNVKKLDLKWKQPDLVNFVTFTVKYLQWDEIYAFEKFVPILTRWQLLNCELIEEKLKKGPNEVRGVLFPEAIKKVRNPKGVPSYEILWTDKYGYFKGLIPEQQLLENPQRDKLWYTIEPQNLVTKAHPDLVEEFVKSKIKPKKQTRRKAKKNDNLDEISDMLKNTSISEPKVKKPRKPRKQKDKLIEKLDDLENSFGKLAIKEKKTRTIDSYFKKAMQNCQKQKDNEDHVITEDGRKHTEKQKNNDSLIMVDDEGLLTSTPNKDIHKKQRSEQKDVSIYFKESYFNSDDEDDSELDDIIDNIVNQRHRIIDKNLEKMGLKPIYGGEGNNKVDDIPNSLDDSEYDCDQNRRDNRSSFFITAPTEDDLFEKTFNTKNLEDTIEYEFNEEMINSEEHLNKDKIISSGEDSFEEKYVPLKERLRVRLGSAT